MKKGFTLIELLAVLIVLAIIAVIAVPIVLNVIKETKEKSYDISVQNVMRAAKIYDLESELTDTPIGMDQNIYDGLKKNLNGTVPDNGTVYIKASTISTSKEIAFALQYGEWCYTKAYGEKTYSKAKSETCVVPFEYLVIDEDVKKIAFTKPELGKLDYFLNGPLTREQIQSITTIPSSEVPTGFEEFNWVVSQSGNSKIMAWYKIDDETNLYDVYIGQDGGVKTKGDYKTLFAYLTNVKSIDLTYFDTTQITNMQGMFYYDSQLTNLILGSNFDTSQVLDMSYIFSGCSGLMTLDVSNFDTSKVTNMYAMFLGCSGLTTLDVSNFDTSKVENMGSMFEGCSMVSSLNVKDFNTSLVTNMASMFRSCSNLIELDVSNFDTSKVTSMYYMFYYCSKLNQLDVSNFDTSKVTNMSNMFRELKKLQKLDVSGFETEGVTNMGSMFQNCNLLTELDVSNFNTKDVKDMSFMFYDCKLITNLDVSNFDTSQTTSMASMFWNCDGLTSLDLRNFDTSQTTIMTKMFYSANNLKPIFVGENWAVAPTATDMFNGCATKNAEQLCEPNSQEEWCIVS